MEVFMVFVLCRPVREIAHPRVRLILYGLEQMPGLSWINGERACRPSMKIMEPLPKHEIERFAALMRKRKQHLLKEIRQVLTRSGNEHYADLFGEAGDIGDESVATLMSDIANAEVSRDLLEVRDIVGAEERIAAGRYGVCIDCGGPIGLERLKAYPSCKRCIRCQQVREKTRASTPHPKL
jgi:RNA polymerase-binding transcription factor DksA